MVVKLGLLKGQILDLKGKPLQTTIKLVTITGICRENLLTHSKSDSDGLFEISYSEKVESFILSVFHDKNLIQILEKAEVQDNLDLSEIQTSTQNLAVTGKVVDENGQPLSGLMVTAIDVDIGPDDFLGCTWTDENGNYLISYNPSRYHFKLNDDSVKESAVNPLSIIKRSASMLDREPDIVVKVYDKLGVFEIKKTPEHPIVEDVVKEIDPIIIPRSWVEGWHVTMDNEAPSRLTSDNTFQPLVDNEKALKTMINAVESAKSYLYLTQFEFRPDFLANPQSAGEVGVTLTERLIEASERGVKVRILINQNLVIPDDYDEIAELFEDTNVKVRPFNAQGPHVMHAKILLADGEDAFIIGSPFAQSYWDTVKHYIGDLRRGSNEKPPVHDVSIHIKGGTVPFIEENFLELWNYLSDKEYNGADKLKPRATLVSSGKNSLQVVRSITPRTLIEDGEKGVLEMYRRAIGNAQDFIYMENQYFTNRYIVKALKSAPEKNQTL